MMHQEIDTATKQIITAEQAWFYSVVPKSVEDSVLELYANEGHQPEGFKDELELILGRTIALIPIPEEELVTLLSRNYRKIENNQNGELKQLNLENDFLTSIIDEASSLKSSDIHIEIYEEKARVRFRIDGKLLEKYILSKEQYPSLINKIKIKANLDISEKRLPQDGRILFSQDNKIDIRVSVLPSMFGEKIVMRLLKKDATELNLAKLGLTDKQLQDYKNGIQKAHGIVLISGPTGSGKTTTLYSTLKVLNKNETNILTIEDPVEYTLEGINQVQLKEDIGLTFARTLRTFLRQDPDVIMLGEIRDKETAQMAIRASLTGHLVLSTVHTNSAWEIVNRLIDMGIPGYLLASTLNLAVAQRLVRKLCPGCRKEVPINVNDAEHPEVKKLALNATNIAVGCSQCYYTGYKGRIAVYEVIPVDERVAGLIRKEEVNINEYMLQSGILKMKDVAVNLLRQGETSLEEIMPLLIS